MLSHVFVGITNFERAYAFYAPVMAALDQKLYFSSPSKPLAAWKPKDRPRPLFLIGSPANSEPATPGNGQMVALLAPNRSAVANVYAVALQHGGTCEGKPGLRPQYHINYYGAYFRDPDGNKLCVCCHDPE